MCTVSQLYILSPRQPNPLGSCTLASFLFSHSFFTLLLLQKANPYPFLCFPLISLLSSCRNKKMPINKDPSTPPPMIGKIGPYTVFMTPPSTPSPKSTATAAAANESTFPVFDSPKKVVSPPPVQPPPQQIDKSVYSHQVADGSVLGLFKNAVNKVQNGLFSFLCVAFGLSLKFASLFVCFWKSWNFSMV